LNSNGYAQMFGTVGLSRPRVVSLPLMPLPVALYYTMCMESSVEQKEIT